MVSAETSYIIWNVLLWFHINSYYVLIATLVSFVIVFYICNNYSQRIKKEAKEIRKERIPKDILIKWPLED